MLEIHKDTRNCVYKSARTLITIKAITDNRAIITATDRNYLISTGRTIELNDIQIFKLHKHTISICIMQLSNDVIMLTHESSTLPILSTVSDNRTMTLRINKKNCEQIIATAPQKIRAKLREMIQQILDQKDVQCNQVRFDNSNSFYLYKSHSYHVRICRHPYDLTYQVVVTNTETKDCRNSIVSHDSLLQLTFGDSIFNFQILRCTLDKLIFVIKVPFQSAVIATYADTMMPSNTLATNEIVAIINEFNSNSAINDQIDSTCQNKILMRAPAPNSVSTV